MSISPPLSVNPLSNHSIISKSRSTRSRGFEAFIRMDRMPGSIADRANNPRPGHRASARIYAEWFLRIDGS